MKIKPDMNIKERFLHVLLFQLTAGLFSVFIGLLISGKSVIQTSISLLIGAFIAMLWNGVFNYGFDRIMKDERAKRSIKIRSIHACLFELGILSLLTPTYAFLLQTPLINAFALNMSIAGYFLVYTYLFNWVYDKIRNTITTNNKIATT